MSARILFRIVAIAALVGLVAVFWSPLAAWFTGKPPGETHASQPTSAIAPIAAASVQPFKLPDPALEYSRAAFNALDSVRALLAKDTVDGVSQRAGELGVALRSAAGSAGSAPADVASCLRDGAQTADRLATAKSLDEARERFAELAQYLIALAAADPRLQEGWHVFRCPMAKGFDKWFQRSPKMENPYMGQRMLVCGSPTSWTVAPPAAEGRSGQADGEIAHYTCSMHPSVKSDAPGACPICGMDLTPVTRGELESGVIHLDEARRQRIGVKTAPVKVGPMDLSFRALGRVTYDETALKDVTLKLDGYIQKLHVDATGVAVKKGDVLFTLYSPELYAAQQEYLLARNSQSAANASLVRASRKRLELWGLTPGQIDGIAEKGEPLEDVPFLSPASGYVIEKNVVEGGAIKAGEKLFRVAPLQTVWVEADVYEQQLPLVKVGQQVEVTLPYLPGETYRGKVAFLSPSLDAKTRTGKIRIELPNPNVVLKPDMYANVRFVLGGKPALQVPESAVIYTGPRRLVFLDLGEGRLRPQEVKLGMQGEGSYEVLEGLKEGDRVVTSGNFLIAAESRIRSAADYWTGEAN